jgi:choline kinase
MNLVVLAAGQSHRPRTLSEDRPNALAPFLGRPLLDWTLSAARECGIGDVTVVGGHKFENLASYQVRLLKNADFATTSMVGSLMVADQFFGDEFVVSYGDIAFRPEVLRTLLASKAEIGVVVDLDWQPYWERRFGDPLADARSLRMLPDGKIRSIGQTVERIEDVQAQFAGMVVFRGRGVKALRRAWQRAQGDAVYRRPILGHCNALTQLTLTDVLDELISGDVPATAVPIRGGWVELDRSVDVAAAEERWSQAPKSEPDGAAGGPAAGGSSGGPAGGSAGGDSASSGPAPGSLPTIYPVRRR